LRQVITHAFSRATREDEFTAMHVYHDSRYPDGSLMARQQAAHLVLNLKEIIIFS
jgi:hypothetical protein